LRIAVVSRSEAVKQNSKSYRRGHRRNPRWGIPEIDYPTLEILPVIHFPCEEYASPGYADVSSRCQIKDKYSKDIRNPDREIESPPEQQRIPWWFQAFCLIRKKESTKVSERKSIKIRYFPPKPQDDSTFNNSIIRQPQINTTHYGSAQEYVPQYTSEDNFERFSSTEYPSLKNNKEVEPTEIKLGSSAVHYKKEIYDDYEDLISAFDDLYQLGNETQKGEKTRDDNVTHIQQSKHPVNGNLFHKNRKPASNKNLYTTIYSESTTLKKSKIVEPKLSLIKLNRRYGERLNTQVTTTKKEKVILFQTTPALEDFKIPSRIGFKTKQFRVSQHEVTTTPLAPVYIHTEIFTDSPDKSDNKSTQNDSVTNPTDIETNKTLSEFDITSKFVNRISNLVSETKAHSDDSQQNLSSTHNLINKDVPYTVSVRVSSKYVLPSNRSSSTKSSQNSTDAMRTLQPWLINGSSSPKLDSFGPGEKINRNMSLWNALLNRNSTKINNSHGGFIVVKKVSGKFGLQRRAHLLFRKELHCLQRLRRSSEQWIPGEDVLHGREAAQLQMRYLPEALLQQGHSEETHRRTLPFLVIFANNAMDKGRLQLLLEEFRMRYLPSTTKTF
ncbi:chitin-binding type-2 domain-containing protein, partial [Caerostris extrusa]